MTFLSKMTAVSSLRTTLLMHELGPLSP